MRPGMFAALAALSFAAMASGCSLSTDPPETRLIAYIEGLDTDDPQIVVPATATAGTAFTVSISTIWQNGCVRMGQTEIAVEQEWVLLTPTDIIVGATADCVNGVKRFTHTPSVRFDNPGEYTVYVQGRSPSTDEMKTVEFPVVVE